MDGMQRAKPELDELGFPLPPADLPTGCLGVGIGENGWATVWFEFGEDDAAQAVIESIERAAARSQRKTMKKGVMNGVWWAYWPEYEPMWHEWPFESEEVKDEATGLADSDPRKMDTANADGNDVAV